MKTATVLVKIGRERHRNANVSTNWVILDLGLPITVIKPIIPMQ